MIRTAAARLGFTLQCTAVTVLALTAFSLGILLGADALYGVAIVAAFLAGSTRGRADLCDDCDTSLVDWER
jgi:hypothetical protein